MLGPENMKMSSPTPNSKVFRKFSMNAKSRPFKVAILGQNGVGKSALTVRFLTRRFIGEYDPDLEKIYTCTKCIDGETVSFEVLDTAAQGEAMRVEEKIKWADAFILVYSVTDRLSFNECGRLKFLINSYTKRGRKISVVSSSDGQLSSAQVYLVGNKADMANDRMISDVEGRQRSAELGCTGFYEISVREDVDSVMNMFQELYISSKKHKRFRHLHSKSDVHLKSSETHPDVPPIDDSSTYRRSRRLRTMYSIT